MTQFTSGQTLTRPTSFKGVDDVIVLKTKFNYGWLVSRSNSMTNVKHEFVWAERYILNNFTLKQ